MLWYLATPYSKYKDGIQAAFEEACRAAAYLMKMGDHVYSPIAHSHPIAMIGGLDPLDHDMWMALDEKAMRGCDGLIVLKMDGWDQSKGVGIEIDAFAKAGKPIRMIEWPPVQVTT